jgi:membrane protease YdiL (CAAX protease family)
MQSNLPTSSRASLVPVFVAALVWPVFAALTPWLGVWGGVGGAALLLGAAFIRAYPKTLSPLWQFRRRHLVLGVGAGIVMIAATYALYPLLTARFPDLQVQTRELYHLFNSGPATLRLLLPLVILGEELVWRGAAQSAAMNRLGPLWGALVTALVYGAAHVPVGSPLLAGVAFACGLYWGLLRAYSGSLVPALLSHLMWDLLVMLWLPLAR